MDDKLSIKRIKEKVSNLKAERTTWENHWQEIADYCLPRKNTIVTVSTPGEKRVLNVLDNTGIYSAELLAGQLHGLLTSPNALWFEYTTGDTALDQRDDVRFFLQFAAKATHNVLNNTNFQTEVHELYIDEVTIGTAAMYIEEDEKDVVRFATKFIAEYYIDEDAQGRVNQLYNCWKRNAYQLVQIFGIDKVGEKVVKAYEAGKDEKFEVIHAIYPREMISSQKLPMKYISQYILPEHNHEIEVGGFMEFPYVVPRWSKGTGEKYGRSPAMTALPEVKTLNKMTETVMMGAQKVVDPPLQMPDEGFLLPIITRPAGINFYRAGSTDRIEPLFNDSRIDFGYDSLKDKKAKIREAFFIDQLMLQQGPQMTATEVMQRTEEKMRLLGPMLGRQQSEFLSPMIDRVFNIMMRRKIIDPETIPPILQGKKVSVKYSSMIAKAQRMTEAQNIMRFLEASGPFIQLDPAVSDNINGDKAIKVIAEVFGFPQQVIRTEKEVKDIRGARAEAQQAAIAEQQQAQAINNAATAMPLIQGEQ